MMLAALAVAVAVGAGGPDRADVDHLAWISGTWSVVKDGATVREMWLSPKDGAMAGVTLTTRPGQPAKVEYAKITAEPGGVTYVALVGRQAPTPFVLLPDAAGDQAVFENKGREFPQRIIYRRCGADLCARIEGLIKGRLQSEEWRYRRVR